MRLRARRTFRRVLRALAWAPPVIFLQPFLLSLGPSRQRRGLARLREWAARAGFRESLSSSGLGTFAGEAEGRSVVVNLEARPWCVALFRTVRTMTIREAAPRRDEGESFATGNTEFDDLYRTRRGSGAEVEVVRSRPDLPEATLALYDDRLPMLRMLRILPYGVQADFVTDEFHPAIDAAALEELLPALARLAAAWDDALPRGDDSIDPARFERPATR